MASSADAPALAARAAAAAASGDWMGALDAARRAVEADDGLADAHKTRG